MAKYIGQKDIKNIEDERIKNNKKIVFARGSFDVITVCDIRYLRSAKNTGDILVVGLYSDVIIQQKFGSKKPITPFEDRLEILKEMEMIDYILKIDSENIDNISVLFNPDIVINEKNPDKDVVRYVFEKCSLK